MRFALRPRRGSGGSGRGAMLWPAHALFVRRGLRNRLAAAGERGVAHGCVLARLMGALSVDSLCSSRFYLQRMPPRPPFHGASLSKVENFEKL